MDFKNGQFCVYIVANEIQFRDLAFNLLHERKNIVAPGLSKNNATAIDAEDSRKSRSNPDWQQDKIDYMRNFKFALVFENSEHPGYTTEKIVDTMVAGCIPIRWGNSEIQKEFNVKSFFNMAPFINVSMRKLPDLIKTRTDRFSRQLVYLVKNRGLRHGINRFFEVESNHELLFAKLTQPCIKPTCINNVFDFQRNENRLFEIIEG